MSMISLCLSSSKPNVLTCSDSRCLSMDPILFLAQQYATQFPVWLVHELSWWGLSYQVVVMHSWQYHQYWHSDWICWLVSVLSKHHNCYSTVLCNTSTFWSCEMYPCKVCFIPPLSSTLKPPSPIPQKWCSSPFLKSNHFMEADGWQETNETILKQNAFR